MQDFIQKGIQKNFQGDIEQFSDPEGTENQVSEMCKRCAAAEDLYSKVDYFHD